jgi:putative lipoprotein
MITLALGACATGPAQPDAAVTGTATYRERIALPDDAVMTVELADVSLADAPSTTLAQQRISPVRVPVSFRLDVDRAKIDPRHTYAVSASVRDASGKLLFVTDTRHSVLTHGAGDKVDIVMIAVAH